MFAVEFFVVFGFFVYVGLEFLFGASFLCECWLRGNCFSFVRCADKFWKLSSIDCVFGVSGNVFVKQVHRENKDRKTV